MLMIIEEIPVLRTTVGTKMNTRGRKIEFAEMVNPHLRITGRITSKLTTKNRRALSLDGARLPHSEAVKKGRRLSNAGQTQPCAPGTDSDLGIKKERPDPSNLSSAEKAVESDTSSLAENSPNQSKSCDFKAVRARQNGRKSRPSEVMTESAVLNSPETDGDVSMSSCPSMTTTQSEQNQQPEDQSFPEESHRKQLNFDPTSSVEITPPVDATTPVETDTSKRFLRTNRSRDYKFLAGLCSENHLKRKFLESETASRRTSDPMKGFGKSTKKARLEGDERPSTHEAKVFGAKFTKDDCVRTFEIKDQCISNCEAENTNCLVTVKAEIDDEAFHLIPSPSPAVKLEEAEPVEEEMEMEDASEAKGDSSVECSVKLEKASDDVAQMNSVEEAENATSSLTGTNDAGAPVNSLCSDEETSSGGTDAKDIQLEEADIKAPDITESPRADNQPPLKCPYKDPKLLCLIEKLNSGATKKSPSPCLLNSSPCLLNSSPCLLNSSPCLLNSSPCLLNSPEAKVNSEANSSHESSFQEDEAVVSVKLEEMEVKRNFKKEEEMTDDSDEDQSNNRLLSIKPSLNGLLQPPPRLDHPSEISRRRINARKSFELTLSRAASASSSEGHLTSRPSSSLASVDDIAWNSDVVRLDKARKERETGKMDNWVTKHLALSGEKSGGYIPMTSSHNTSTESLSEQKSVFVSQDLDEYLASSPVRRESDKMEPDEPEMDEVDGFTFMAFPSQNSLERHMKKLNVNVLNTSLSYSRRLGDGFSFQSNLASAAAASFEARAACRRKREALLKSGKVKEFSMETLSELGLEININPSDMPSAEPSADESASCTAKVTRRGIAKMGNETRQPRKGKIYGRKVTGRFASKANIKYHVKKTSPDSIAQSNLKGKGGQPPASSACLRAPLKKGRPSLTGQSSSYDINWKPVVITMKMAILALRALSIDSAADVPCNQTDCTCSGKKGVQPEYEPNLSTEAIPVEDVIPIGRPSCQKEHCRLGCICDSLKTPPKKTTTTRAHCGRPECMFGCDCDHLTRSKMLRLFNSESDMSGKEAAELIDGCEPGTKKRKRRGWGIPIDEDLGVFEDHGGNGMEGGNSLRKSNRIKERPQLQDFKKLRKMIYDDIYEWENEEQLRPKRKKIPKLMQREKEPKQPKYARISSTGKGGGGVSAVIKLSAPAALGSAPTDSAATPVNVKTELPTASEISDDDVKIVSAEARRKNGRLEEGGGVVHSVTGGVGGGRKEMQKLTASENSGHLAPPTASRESTTAVSEDEEVDETVTSCARTIIYKRKQGFAGLVATQSKSSDAVHHNRSLLTTGNDMSASVTKQTSSAAMTKPSSLAKPGNKDNVVLANAKTPPSGVGIFTRSVILVKKETGRGKPEERKPVVVLNMSYNVPLEHCKESIASKVYGVWTEGLAVVGQSFEYENLLVEFLPKSDKEIQIPPHIRDTINPNDVHEITIRITKKRENRKNPLLVQKLTTSVGSKGVAVVKDSTEISLSGLKNFVSGAGLFDSSNLALSNAVGRLGTSCVLGPFGVMEKSSVSATKTVFPPLAVTDDGSRDAVAALESGSNAESCVSPGAPPHSKDELTSAGEESHTVHWKPAEERRSSGDTVPSGNDEPHGLVSGEEDGAQPPITDFDKTPPNDMDLAGGSIELKKLLLADGPALSAVDEDAVANIPSPPITPSQSEEVVSECHPASQREDSPDLNLRATSGHSMPAPLPSLPTGSTGAASLSLAPKPSLNADPVTSGDQLVITNTFKLNPKTFDGLPSSTNAPLSTSSSSASTQPGFRLIGGKASKNPVSFRIAPSMVRPMLVTTSANPTGLMVSVSGSVPRSGHQLNTNAIHLAPPPTSLSFPVAVSGSSGSTRKPTSFLVVPKTMVSNLVKTGSTVAGSLLPAQQMVPSGCLLVANSKVLKLGVPVCSTKGDSLLQTGAMLGKTNSSFVQVKPVNTSASGQQRMMIVSTAETANRPRPSASLVLKPGGGGGMDVRRQLATRFAGQSPAKDVIEIKDDSDEEKGRCHGDEEIDILCEAEADGSNEAAILSEKLGIRLESFSSSSSKMDASSPGHPSIAGAPMPPPTQAPKQKRKQMHEEKAEFPTNVEITEGWMRIPADESKADPTPIAVPSSVPPAVPPAVPSVALVPSGQLAEIETKAVEEKQVAPSQQIRPAAAAAVPHPNLYADLYRAITPYLKQTDKTKKKKISPLYITRKATQVIKRITEWQNVLINDLVNERMIYDKLKKRHEKLTAAAGRETDITSEPPGQTSSLQHPANPLPSERRRVPGPLRRKFRSISRKDEDKVGLTNNKPQGEDGGTAVSSDTVVATNDAVVAVNAVAMDDSFASENPIATDNAVAASAGEMLATVDIHGKSADAEQNADRETDGDLKIRDDSSEAIEKAICRNMTDVSIGLLSCDSVAMTTCTLNEKDSLPKTLASSVEHLQSTDFSGEVVTNAVGEVV